MDRHTWMYKIPRIAKEYVDGVEKFIDFAEEFIKKKRRELGKEDMITCPCRDCYNLKKYPSAMTIRDHLFRRGFMDNYTKWIWHGEGIHSEKTRNSDGDFRSNEDSMPTNKEDDVENDRVDEKTKEVFQKMGELESQVSDGSWTPQGHDDILSRALGTKEHGGRVRGVGGSAKIKDVFGSGINKHSGVVSVDELAKITKDITKKVQKEFEEKMNDMMNLKLQGIFGQLKQMGVSLPDDIGSSKNEVIRSSCQSVDREDHFSVLKSPAICSLWVINPEKERVVVARGTVFPSNSPGSNMLHNNPIAPHNVKVSVDNWKVGLASKSYTKKEINEIRELWAKFFILECL